MVRVKSNIYLIKNIDAAENKTSLPCQLKELTETIHRAPPIFSKLGFYSSFYLLLLTERFSPLKFLGTIYCRDVEWVSGGHSIGSLR